MKLASNTISFRELRESLSIVKNETLKKHLADLEVAVYGNCKNQYVFEYDYAIAVDTLFAKGLLKKHPAIWEEIYRNSNSDEGVIESVILIITTIKENNSKSEGTRTISFSNNKYNSTTIKKLAS